jgi:hypothetical protein
MAWPELARAEDQAVHVAGRRARRELDVGEDAGDLEARPAAAAALDLGGQVAGEALRLIARRALHRLAVLQPAPARELDASDEAAELGDGRDLLVRRRNRAERDVVVQGELLHGQPWGT